ncbi:hypothetical protein N7523_000052 [Penicillium sp. IBT 18751x]|nr:hypothetical protein N7523_000052 [Penicillium sp. IBT 18751x]
MASTSYSGVNYGAQVGINYGTFTADFHLPPERPETPPSPLSTVPFARDPDSVSRDTLLNQIRDKSLVPGSRIALVGLGGVGLVQSDHYAVFWVHASNATRFEQSFRDIANQVKIPGRQDPQANIFNLVENWLQDEKRERWVLILDNVDDHEFLRKSPVTGQGGPKNLLMNVSTKPLLEYLPRSLNGFVIITSRTREVALKLVNYQDLIEVKQMERSEALELLKRKLEQPQESEDSRDLVEELELMPLAIVQAASYIRKRAPRYSVSQYLRDFQKSDREAIKLLNTEAGHLYRDWEAKNLILVTWQISFDYIRREQPSAADLLSLMSFFDRQGISEDLLRVQPENHHFSDSELSNKSGDEEVSQTDTFSDFEDDIATLRDYSFISVSQNSAFFTMHRLVQLTTRVWLKSHRQTEQWKERFISNLYYKVPTGAYENWERCRQLFPHVKAAMSERPKSEESLQTWATLLYNGAWYALRSGMITDGKNMALRSRKQRIRLLGEEHEEALNSTALLAIARSLEGYWKEAEQLSVQVMETRRTKLGADHPSTLASIANLASTYRKQGRWEEAEQLEVQVMETSKTKLGPEHPDTLTSMANLAFTWKASGQNVEAINILRSCLVKQKQALGQDHPQFLANSEALEEWEADSLVLHS